MRNKKQVYRLALLLAICAAMALAGAALAAGEVLTRSVVSSAGGQDTVNGIEARSAIGQPVAGIVTTGGSGGVCVGFLCPGSGSEQGMPEITPTATAETTPTAETTGTPSTTPNSTGTPDSTTTPETTGTPGETPTPDPSQTPASTTTPGATPTPSPTSTFGDKTDVYLPLIKNGS